GGEDRSRVIVSATEGAKHKEVGLGVREDDPFAAACMDEGAGRKPGVGGAHVVRPSPNTERNFETAVVQSSSYRMRITLQPWSTSRSSASLSRSDWVGVS